jgi:hypothetical protein
LCPTCIQIIFNDKVVSPGFQKNGIAVSQIGIKMYVTIQEIGVQVMFTGLIFSVEVPFSTFTNNTEGQCGESCPGHCETLEEDSKCPRYAHLRLTAVCAMTSLYARNCLGPASREEQGAQGREEAWAGPILVSPDAGPDPSKGTLGPQWGGSLALLSSRLSPSLLQVPAPMIKRMSAACLRVR